MEEFDDFYALLGIEVGATDEVVRRQFRRKMREWHPDVNKTTGATQQTQRIIVAYKILSDPEARRRYDTEYNRHFQRSRPVKQTDSGDYSESSETSTTGYSDRDLERWIRSAREAAVNEMRAFASELKDQSMVAAQAATKMLVMMVIFAILGLILMTLS